MRTLFWVTVVVCGAVPRTIAAYELYYRDSLKVDTPELYGNMLTYLKDGQWDKLQKALDLLKPVSREINKAFNKNVGDALGQAIQNKSGERARRELYAFILYDIKELFRQVILGSAQTKSIHQSKYWLLLAYQDYLLFSPVVKAKDTAADAKINRLFKQAYRLAGDSPFVFKPEQEVAKALQLIETTCETFLSND